jgi:hypothetical protein
MGLKTWACKAEIAIKTDITEGSKDTGRYDTVSLQVASDWRVIWVPAAWTISITWRSSSPWVPRQWLQSRAGLFLLIHRQNSATAPDSSGEESAAFFRRRTAEK